MSILFRSPADFLERAGQPLGATDWLPIGQDRIDRFADATGDHQWIHVDPERAKKGPFSGCIAHGYLTLSLVNLFLPQLVQVANLSMGVNYGCDKVRFPAPVPANARIRGVGELLRVEALPGNGVQSTVRVTVEIEGRDKPGCVADTISRYFFI